jgi:hypothetical protein
MKTKRLAKGAVWVKKDDPKKVVCLIPAVIGYRVKGRQILRIDPKMKMGKKQRRAMRKANNGNTRESA